MSSSAYIYTGPEVYGRGGLCVPFVLCLLWHVERPRVDGITEVLVQGLREEVYVLFPECLVPLVHELGLWRIGVGHCDEAVESRCGKSNKTVLLLDPKVLYHACAHVLD